MKVGEVVGEEWLSEGKPLEGVRVLAIEQMQALPYATQLLARLGADVVKVEHPVTGDSGRGSLPPVEDSDGRAVGPTYLRNNLCKRSISVDLKQPEGIELIRRLVPRFDVVGENFRSGTLERLGLGYETLSALHPGLIYLSVSGFGNLHDSPYRAWGAYAPIGEAMAGLYEDRREPGEPYKVSPVGPLGDTGSALFATIGILAALRQRERTGHGQYVDIAMFDAMVAMADTVPSFWSLGVRPDGEWFRRIGGIVNVFQAKDGAFVLQAIREHQLAAVAHTVGHPEWLEDERLAERTDWTARVETLLRPAIEAWASDKTMLEACEILNERGVASGPCFGAEQIVTDAHVRSRNMLVEVPRPDSDEPLLLAGNPVKLSQVAEGPLTRWPTLGEHTDSVLREELGLGAADLSALRAKGVIGSQRGSQEDE